MVSPHEINLNGKFSCQSHPNACGSGYNGTTWFVTNVINGYTMTVLDPFSVSTLLMLCGGDGEMPNFDDVYSITGYFFSESKDNYEHSPLYVTGIEPVMN